MSFLLFDVINNHRQIPTADCKRTITGLPAKPVFHFQIVIDKLGRYTLGLFDKQCNRNSRFHFHHQVNMIWNPADCKDLASQLLNLVDNTAVNWTLDIPCNQRIPILSTPNEMKINDEFSVAHSSPTIFNVAFENGSFNS